MRGADEVVIANLAGELTEAAVSNIAFVRSGEVITPALNAGILPGITRDLMIREIAARAGCGLREVSVKPEDLSEMHECFLLSTTKDITPVSSIDAHRFRVGEDTVTMQIKSAFAAFVREYSDAHPNLSVSAL